MVDSRPGRFVWYELMTADVEAAKAFYGHVIGWTTQPFQGSDYTMWVSAQGPLGGVMALPEEAKKMGVAPHWMANLEVADVDAAVEKVVKAGGRVFKPAEDMPTIGRFAVVADPQGAMIALFKPEGEMGNHDSQKAGACGWHELSCDDHEAAFALYSDLVGWEKVSEFDMGPMGKYWLFGKDGKQLGGMMSKPKDQPMPTAWSYYFRVEDLDAALERAKGREARLLHGPMAVPGGERVALLVDPQGAPFSLLSLPVKAA